MSPKNRLNDLSPKDWLKFQKSWFLHNPPPRRKDVLRHPAKFPETLAQQFIEFFTRQGQVVLDPMAGTGSTLVAALRSGRHSYGIELNPAYAELACQVVVEERAALGQAAEGLAAQVITGNAAEMARHAAGQGIPPVDYVLTSPPYWDMLHAQRRHHAEDTPGSCRVGRGVLGPSRRPGQYRRLRSIPGEAGGHLCRLTALPQAARLPDDHRQECKEGRARVSVGLGPGPRGWGRCTP